MLIRKSTDNQTEPSSRQETETQDSRASLSCPTRWPLIWAKRPTESLQIQGKAIRSMERAGKITDLADALIGPTMGLKVNVT